VPFAVPERTQNSLESVTERAMPNVMKKSGDQGDFCSLFVVLGFTNFTLDDPREFSGNIKNTYAMSKACVRCARKHKFRHTKLLNTPKPLKFGRVYKLPCKFIDIVTLTEYNEAMDRIPKPLRLKHGLSHIVNIS